MRGSSRRGDLEASFETPPRIRLHNPTLPPLYVIAGLPRTRMQDLTAAYKWVGPSGAISGRTAGELWQMIEDPDKERVELTSPRDPRSAPQGLLLPNRILGEGWIPVYSTAWS